MGLYIDMINVGQGDCFLLTLDSSTEGTYYILIDGGPVKAGDYVVKHLREITNGHIHVIIGTHLDSDHIGSLRNVIENISVGCVLLNTPDNMQSWIAAREVFKKMGESVKPLRKLVENLSVVENLLHVISENNIPLEPALAGRRWKHGEDIEIRILNPTKDRLKATWADEILKNAIQGVVFETSEAPKTSPRNNSSIIVELLYKGSHYALFTADAGADVIKEVTKGNQYSFLKVPHHGAKTGLDEELLSQFKPNAVYLSVGDNVHGHPATEILDMIKEVGAKVFCTNRTKFCRRDCSYNGFGSLCVIKDKESRPSWTSVDPKRCINNI